LLAGEEEWQARTVGIKKIYKALDGVTDGVSKMYMSLKHMQSLSPVLAWNSEIFIQYFKQAVTLSISTPLFT